MAVNSIKEIGNNRFSIVSAVLEGKIATPYLYLFCLMNTKHIGRVEIDVF